jgi:hypothetical protein
MSKNLYDYMKGSKVKNINIFLLVSLLVPYVSMAGSQFCFEREVSIYCEAELGANYSLNGYFVKNSKHYDFAARRAFDGGWCQDALKAIMTVMKSGHYCMEFEETEKDVDLTIDSVVSRTSQWTYFQ